MSRMLVSGKCFKRSLRKLEWEWPSFFFFFGGTTLRMLIMHILNIFDMVEIRRFNRCSTSVGQCDKTSRTCGRSAAAVSDVEFLLNLILWIEFDQEKMRCDLLIRHGWNATYEPGLKKVCNYFGYLFLKEKPRYHCLIIDWNSLKLSLVVTTKSSVRGCVCLRYLTHVFLIFTSLHYFLRWRCIWKGKNFSWLESTRKTPTILQHKRSEFPFRWSLSIKFCSRNIPRYQWLSVDSSKLYRDICARSGSTMDLINQI